MREACVSCGDTHRVCLLNCVMPAAKAADADAAASPEQAQMAWPFSTPATLTSLSACAGLCDATRATCKEEDVAAACLECSTNCSSTYKSEMELCVSATSRATKMTFGQNLDSCANLASARMDACADSCHGQTASDQTFPLGTSDELVRQFLATRMPGDEREAAKAAGLSFGEGLADKPAV